MSSLLNKCRLFLTNVVFSYKMSYFPIKCRIFLSNVVFSYQLSSSFIKCRLLYDVYVCRDKMAASTSSVSLKTETIFGNLGKGMRKKFRLFAGMSTQRGEEDPISKKKLVFFYDFLKNFSFHEKHFCAIFFIMVKIKNVSFEYLP